MGRLHPDFTDETVVVTGAASGIGRAVALGFGDAGATVLVADVRETPKDPGETVPTHERIVDAGGRAEYVETDVADLDEVATLVGSAREFGGVDVMVNNAGIYVNTPFREIEPGEFDRILAVNARGVFFGTRIAAEDMIERSVEGSIVNTASTSAVRASPTHSHYSVSKGGVRMATRSAALELAEHGIRVNAVAPGATATEITEGWSRRAREMEGGFPGRAADPGELAGAYLYLASEDASYVNGEMLFVDGGSHVT
jgi:NAD(P)-dependent dehydrogenase (short-subunit alcohol dehydrogenase family)